MLSDGCNTHLSTATANSGESSHKFYLSPHFCPAGLFAVGLEYAVVMPGGGLSPSCLLEASLSRASSIPLRFTAWQNKAPPKCSCLGAAQAGTLTEPAVGTKRMAEPPGDKPSWEAGCHSHHLVHSLDSLPRASARHIPRPCHVHRARDDAGFRLTH